MPRKLTKDQRYTKKKRAESKRLRCRGHITNRQISLRVGEEELGLLEMWMAQKEWDMTALVEEIIATLPNEVNEYAVRNHPDTRSGKRVAGGKPNKRICVWIRSTLHEKLKVHAKAKALSMNRFLLEVIRITGSGRGLKIVCHKVREMGDGGMEWLVTPHLYRRKAPTLEPAPV